MDRVESFLRDLDARWTGVGNPIDLKVIGASALTLQLGYERGTQDTDVLEVEGVTKDLLEIAEKGSDLHRRHNLYLQVVGEAILFLPQKPNFQKKFSLEKITVWVLDPVDIALSKLARYHADDADDIEMLVGEGHVDHDQLVERFRAAVDWYSMDARVAKLPRFLKNLHKVERDYFDVEKTDIELPEAQ